MISRVNVGGGGVTPYIVNVTCASDFAGQTITMSQSGHTTVRAVCPSTSPYVVSLKPMYSGTWTISGTVGGVTYTNTIALSAFGTYTSVLNAFNATLTVTSVEGAVVTATMGSLTVSGTIASGETTVSLSIPQSGTWSVTDNTSFGDTHSVSITVDGQTYAVNMAASIYQAVSYLQTSGTQWIDMGVTDDTTDFDFEMDAQFTSTSFGASGTPIFGALGSSAGYSCLVFQSKFLLSAPNTDFTLTPSLDRFTFSCVDGIVEYNETQLGTFISSVYVGSINLYLGHVKQTSGFYGVTPASMKWYSFKLWKDGTQVRNFIPCYRRSDSVAGMYDIVNDVFYDNDGTGTFVVGEDVA